MIISFVYDVANIKIENMIRKSRDEYVYTVLDICEKLDLS